MSRGRTGVRAVLLDAMGTLVRLEPIAPALRRELRERHRLVVPAPATERAALAEMRYYRQHHHEGRDEDSLRDLRRRCARVLGQALGETARSIEEEALVTALLSAIRFTPFEDAPAALRELRARGVRLVVVSNWDVSLPGVLAQVGLAPLLDGVFTSAAVGACKPREQIFAAALQSVGVAAADALHVGDSEEHDVRGARAAGIGAVLIDREGVRDDRCDLTTIRSLSELPRLAA